MDHFDLALLQALQRDAGVSQRELAERIGLSQNACWRRLHALRERGLIRQQTVLLGPDSVGLTVFVMVRTRHHSRDWLDRFREAVVSVPNVIDFYLIAGDYD
ncbi:hypothetical protein GCM10023157_20410 [Gluconacetobacter asukensis]